MDINFDLYNGKAKKLEGLLNQLNKRIHRFGNSISDAKSKLVTVTSKVEHGNSSFLDIPENDVKLILDKLNSIFEKHSQNVEKMNNSALNKMQNIENDLENFSSKQLIGNELLAEIFNTEEAMKENNKNHDEVFKRKVLIEKIPHDQSSKLSQLLKKDYIKVNNEIVRINNLLTEIRKLTIEVVKDYHVAKLDALAAMNKGIITMDKTQRLSEEIASFIPLQDSISVAEDKPIIHQERISSCSCGGRGRTAFC